MRIWQENSQNGAAVVNVPPADGRERIIVCMIVTSRAVAAWELKRLCLSSFRLLTAVRATKRRSSMTHEEFKELLNKSADEALKMMKYLYGVDRENPVEVWTATSGILDAVVRRKLRDKLIQAGRNPYTGKVEKRVN